MAEPPAIALGFIQFFDNIKLGSIYFLNNHLCNTVAAFKRIGLRAQINNRDFNLATIVGVNGTGGIDQPDAVLYGQSAARSDLGLKAGWQSDCKTGGDQGAITCV